MSALTRVQRETDEQFRVALLSHGAFKYGITTVVDSGSVSVKRGWVKEGVGRQVLKVSFEGEDITPTAYSGLQVVPVEDDSGYQAMQTMGKNGEVCFDLCVHSVLFRTA